MDAEPYETRGYYTRVGLGAAQGGEKEHFSRDRWIQRDICEKAPYPFEDKELDFVMCSHTLEDIRDPLFVCSEMIRIAKAGYVEVPSRLAETCRGVEPGQVGWSHHRWLIDFEGSNIRFLMKYHLIHSHFRFSFPASFLRSLPIDKTVSWLFWSDSFTFEEGTIHGADNVAKELEKYVQENHPYSPLVLKADERIRRGRYLVGRAVSRIRGRG